MSVKSCLLGVQYLEILIFNHLILLFEEPWWDNNFKNSQSRKKAFEQTKNELQIIPNKYEFHDSLIFYIEAKHYTRS